MFVFGHLPADNVSTITKLFLPASTLSDEIRNQTSITLLYESFERFWPDTIGRGQFSDVFSVSECKTQYFGHFDSLTNKVMHSNEVEVRQGNTGADIRRTRTPKLTTIENRNIASEVLLRGGLLPPDGFLTKASNQVYCLV